MAAALQRALDAIAPRLLPGAGRASGLQRLSGGASQETWRFKLSAGDSPPQRFVLRRSPSGAAARSAGNPSLADEARIIARVAEAGVPVAPVRLVLDPGMGLGDGYVMHHVDGETLGRRIVGEPALAAARRQLARQCGAALARIHAVDPGRLPALRRAPPLAELDRYAEQHRAFGQPKPVFELALRWLRERLPRRDEPQLRLVHGDFRNGNLIVDASGLRAVLDWELAHLGDPMEDLGWICVASWRFGRLDLAVGGFGSVDDLLAGYREAGGEADESQVRLWQVFGTWKWGVICESMALAHLSGAEPSVERATIGRRASEAEIDLLDLLEPEAVP
jgi:aminoglycoside phosphotransferase (APT) family kinase protein